MKSLFFTIALMLYLPFNSMSQNQRPCTNFDDQTLNNWVMHNTTTGGGIVSNTTNNLNATTNQGPSGNATDFALNITDRSGSTWIYNGVNYAGDYTPMLGNCLCFDFQLTTNAPGAFVNPSIVLASNFNPNQPFVWGTNPVLAARFTANIQVTQNSNWVRICAPIDLCDAAGNLPANADGAWTIPNGGTCANWQSLLSNVTHLFFRVDMSGWGGTEIFNIDNVCITNCSNNDEGAYCCDGDNLIENGNFENGLNGFQSQYTSVAAGSPVNPGEYSVIEDQDAATLCSAWDVEDHTSCAGGTNDHVLLVNGQTQQGTNANNVIWQTQQPIQVERDTQYKFCAFVKHLPQCCVDIVPRLRIEYRQSGGTWFTLMNWTPITYTGGNPAPCDWEQIGGTFTSGGPTVEIRILINEMGNGDGNDLVLDDLSLMSLPEPDLDITVQHTGAGNQVVASINQLTNSDDALPDKGCRYTWLVGEVVSLTPTISLTNVMLGNAGTGWGLTTNFPGYTFQNNQLYVVALFVNHCDCTGAGFTYQLTFDMKSLTNRRLLNQVKAFEASRGKDKRVRKQLEMYLKDSVSDM